MQKYIAASVCVGVLAFCVAGAKAVMAGGPEPAGGVSSTPAANTPHFQATKGTPVERVRQLVKCGNTMYAVGSFSRILQGESTYTRRNVFSFSAIAPFTMTSWSPHVNGTVNTIAFNGSNCNKAYIGGSFTSINGTSVRNIAAVSTSTGKVFSGFAHHANKPVETITSSRGHLLVGGFYTSINGSSADPYMTSLNPRTGADTGFLHLKISGNIHWCDHNRCSVPSPTRVYNQQPSHSGHLDLVEGDFTSVGHRRRQQIFMLKLSRKRATVTGWSSPQFMRECSWHHPFYVQAASWSPDDDTVYTASTGYRPYNWDGKYPFRRSLCDSAAAFPARHTSVSDRWINYTGCWSLYSTAAGKSTAYFGGHEEYSENPDGCKFEGPGAYPAPGMEGVSPSDGSLYLNSQGTAGYYSRARGFGADDMDLTSAGLWIASDNYDESDKCGGVADHSGICFLPYPDGG